jgi:hypothetical protein
MLSHSCQSGQHPLRKRGFDLYETPAVALHALLQVEKLPPQIWEPSADRGTVVRVLRNCDHKVTTSDVIDYGFSLDFVADFRAQPEMPAGCEAILTNPPFQIIASLVAHALDLSPLVIVLARLALLEPARRTEILEHRGIARIHCFRNRLPMMHRDGWTGRRASSAIPFAWFVWERNHKGPTMIDRISW